MTARGPALRLRQVDTAEAAPRPETPERRILQALAEADAPLSQRQIRERAATRHHTVGAIVRTLLREGTHPPRLPRALQPRRKPNAKALAARRRQRHPPPRHRAVPGARFRQPLGVRGNRSREPPRKTARQAPATAMRRAIGPWPRAAPTAMDALSRANGGGSPEEPAPAEAGGRSVSGGAAQRLAQRRRPSDTPRASPSSDDHETLWEIRVPIARNYPGDR